jgi:threonine dehydratase
MPMSHLIPLGDIQAAGERIGSSLHRTPLLHSRLIGERAGVELFLKCENLQKTGSFKPRGALHKVLSLDASQRQAGAITVSAGNHAQAVAWAAGVVGVPACVVMPTDAPRSKLDAVRGYGASIVLHDDRATLFDRLHEEQEKQGSTFVHPFDDPVLLAGTASVGLEIVADLPDVDVVYVPVGGGGLMAGVTSAIKQKRPQVRIVAVELAEGPGLQPALDAGRPLPVPRPARTLADGMTPPFVGEIPLRIAEEAVDEVVAVTEEQIHDAMRWLLTRAKLMVEASGAAATAGLLYHGTTLSPGARVVTVVSGGNIDLQALPTLLQR